MAIDICKLHAPFSGNATHAFSLLNLGNGDRRDLLPVNLELSEEDIWEAMNIAASSSIGTLEEVRSSATGSSHELVVSPSLPVVIPDSSCRSRLTIAQDVDYKEETADDDVTLKSEDMCRQWHSWAAPHQIAGRQRMASRQEVMAFSMVEGPGRTLKGRDLTNVRNAVWQTIGFPE